VLVVALAGMIISVPARAMVTILCPTKGASTDSVKKDYSRASYWFGHDPAMELTGNVPMREDVV
jgi:hypothetical protein